MSSTITVYKVACEKQNKMNGYKKFTITQNVFFYGIFTFVNKLRNRVILVITIATIFRISIITIVSKEYRLKMIVLLCY
jgi:hypothetical protein